MWLPYEWKKSADLHLNSFYFCFNLMVTRSWYNIKYKWSSGKLNQQTAPKAGLGWWISQALFDYSMLKSPNWKVAHFGEVCPLCRKLEYSRPQQHRWPKFSLHLKKVIIYIQWDWNGVILNQQNDWFKQIDFSF